MEPIGIHGFTPPFSFGVGANEVILSASGMRVRSSHRSHHNSTLTFIMIVIPARVRRLNSSMYSAKSDIGVSFHWSTTYRERVVDRIPHWGCKRFYEARNF